MSDNDGLGGSSSSNGGGVSSDAGGIGAGHTTLSGAVEQADKAIRDSAASVVVSRDINWNLLNDSLRNAARYLAALDVSSLDFRFDKCETGNFSVVCSLNLGGLTLPFRLDLTGAFHPAKAENGDSQEGDGPNADQEGLRRE